MPSNSSFEPHPDSYPKLDPWILKTSEEEKAKWHELLLQQRRNLQQLVDREVARAVRDHLYDEGKSLREAFDEFATTLSGVTTARINELTTERDKLVTRIAELEGSERPLTTKERTTLLTIIAALLRESKIDWSTPTKAANLIVMMTDKMRVKLSQRTVEGHLNRIDEALQRRKGP